MACAAPLAPTRSCSNYPLCKAKQYRDKHAQKSSFCETCQESQVRCVHPDCSSAAAPAFRAQAVVNLCATHYRDLCHAATRMWRACTNQKFGCRQLAIEPTKGKCFACTNNTLPCVNAEFGCPSHVRYDSKPATRERKACSGHNHTMCAYDPRKKDTCKTPACANPRTAVHGGLCDDCAVRST